MAKKKSVSRADKIKDSIPAELTDLFEQIAPHAKPDDKVMFTRISEGAYIASFGIPISEGMPKDEFIMSPTELPITSIIINLHKYKRDKKIPKTSNKGIAFSKTTLSDFYERVEDHYHISERMVRRYIGRGMIPPPERYGRQAFYDEARSNVFSHLNVIDILKKRYNLSLDDIEEIVNDYRNQIVELDFIFTDIEIEYNKPRRTSPYYVQIKKRLLKKIQGRTENLEKLNIKDMEKEIKRKQS